MKEEIGGYQGLFDKFVGPGAWPNFTKEYQQLVDQGMNVTSIQDQFAKCGE